MCLHAVAVTKLSKSHSETASYSLHEPLPGTEGHWLVVADVIGVLFIK